MKKLHKRTILVASAVGVSATAIGIAAGVVYATQDEISKAQVAQNVEQELENRMFGTISLLPANGSGSFDSDRLKTNEKTLISIKKDLANIRREFTLNVKTKLPIYGIINDVLNVSSRFETYEDFIKNINMALTAINDKDWSSLQTILFDESNYGDKKLLSKSYGVERADIDGSKLIEAAAEHKVEADAKLKAAKTTKEKAEAALDVTKAEQEVKDAPNKVDFSTKDSFISFGEYVSKLQDSATSQDDKDMYVGTIVSALSMLTGFGISNNGTAFQYDKLADTTVPTGSVVYMLHKLRTDAVNGDKGSRAIIETWDDSILPTWNKRYHSIDQFYDDSHNPISAGALSSGGVHTDTNDLDAFVNYDKNYANEQKHATLISTMETYLDGHETNGFTDTTSSAARFLTNWDFLRIFFGQGFEGMIQSTSGAGTVIGGLHSFDQVLVDNSTVSINGVAVKSYWAGVIANIFTKNETAFITRTAAGPATGSEDLWDKLKDVADLEASFKKLNDTTQKYKDEVSKISGDHLSIGIKLDDLKEVVDEYGLASGWKININSISDNSIDEQAIKKLEASLKYNPDTKELAPNPSEYHIYNGYIFPTDSNWLLRSTDTLELDKISFKDDSRLKPFEDEKFTTTIFKPYIRINEDAGNKVSINILWDHITGQIKGGN